jgi:hypothetical protein
MTREQKADKIADVLIKMSGEIIDALDAIENPGSDLTPGDICYVWNDCKNFSDSDPYIAFFLGVDEKGTPKFSPWYGKVGNPDGGEPFDHYRKVETKEK